MFNCFIVPFIFLFVVRYLTLALLQVHPSNGPSVPCHTLDALIAFHPEGIPSQIEAVYEQEVAIKQLSAAELDGALQLQGRFVDCSSTGTMQLPPTS